jgi:hypothetical protein
MYLQSRIPEKSGLRAEQVLQGNLFYTFDNPFTSYRDKDNFIVMEH